MTIVMILDTETTHIDTKIARIVQLSWILHDTETNEYTENDFVLKVPIKIENSHIHGITKEQSDRGYEFSWIVNILLEDIEKCDIMVLHNAKYDFRVIEIELSHLGMDDEIDLLYSKEVFDTMLECINICKIKNQYGKNKFPKLIEAYRHFFGCDFPDQHNALGDIRATFEIYKKLVST